MAQVDNPSGLHICNAVMATIAEINRSNNPMENTTPVGALQALYDPTNRNGTRIEEVDSMTGQIRNVRILYKQRGTPDDTGDTKTCSTGNETTLIEKIMSVGLYREAKVTVTEARIKTLCENAVALQQIKVQGGNTNNNNFLRMKEVVDDIMLQMDGARQAIEADIIAALVTQMGAWVGGDASKNFAMLDAGSGDPLVRGFTNLGHEYRFAGMNGLPICVGYGNFDLANRGLKYGCCNDGGTDFSKMTPGTMHKYYESFQIDSALGDNAVAIWAPGTVQLATYNEYRAGRGGRIDNVNRGLMPDVAVPGLIWDFRLIEDGCGEQYTMIAGLNFDLWVQPLDGFKVTDRLNGVNGVFQAVITEQYKQYQVVP